MLHSVINKKKNSAVKALGWSRYEWSKQCFMHRLGYEHGVVNPFLYQQQNVSNPLEVTTTLSGLDLERATAVL